MACSSIGKPIKLGKEGSKKYRDAMKKPSKKIYIPENEKTIDKVYDPVDCSMFK